MWYFKSHEHAALYFGYLPLRDVSLFYFLQKEKKVILPRDNGYRRAKVYFHSFFPLTSLQPAYSMLFCKNKIPVDLSYISKQLLCCGNQLKRGKEGLVVWELFRQCSKQAGFRLTCWRRFWCSCELLKFFPMSKRQKVSCRQRLTHSRYSSVSGMRSRKIRYASHTASWQTVMQHH